MASCKDTDSLKVKLDHLRHHVVRECQKCKLPMSLLDETLPFGEALLTTWECHVCKATDMTVLQPDGTLLEMDRREGSDQT